MAAAITFFADDGVGGPNDIQVGGGSGLGFYGAGGFGASVAVDAYQKNTYITNPAGALQGAHTLNIEWTASDSGEIAGDTNLNLENIPNSKCTTNVRFTNDAAVQVQNAELRIYDRNNIDEGASGVVTKAYAINHVTDTESGEEGSGGGTWTTPVGSSVVLSLEDSPGESGFWAQGSSVHEDTRHDWYVALSAKPDSIGSKTLYGMYVSLEYL